MVNEISDYLKNWIDRRKQMQDVEDEEEEVKPKKKNFFQRMFEVEEYEDDDDDVEPKIRKAEQTETSDSGEE